LQSANDWQYELMDSKAIRLANLWLLIKEAGSKAALARRASTDASYISQITSEKARREVGDELARMLERGMMKPRGWMDMPRVKEWQAAGISVPYSSGALTAAEPSHVYRVEAPDILQRLPIIPWERVTEWLETPFQTEYSVPIWRRPGAPAKPPYSEKAFALTVETDQWSPELSPGTTLFIDPAAASGHKGWVLVQLPGRPLPGIWRAVGTLDPAKPALTTITTTNAPAEPMPAGSRILGSVLYVLP
jgi:hypothetical protein